jgi:hypothetical protein
MRRYLRLLPVLILTGCSGGDEPGPAADRGHVWQEQTDMLDKAEGIEDLLGDTATRQGQRIDEQAH